MSLTRRLKILKVNFTVYSLIIMNESHVIWVLVKVQYINLYFFYFFLKKEFLIGPIGDCLFIMQYTDGRDHNFENLTWHNKKLTFQVAGELNYILYRMNIFCIETLCINL